MIKKKINSVQEWLPIKEFYDDGILQLKNGKMVKIIQVFPINYELKSEFEKKSILNAYQTFLKNCNFDMQIIVQSNQEDLTENIQKMKEHKEKKLKDPILENLFNSYIHFIQKKNQEKLSSSKNFYLLVCSNKYPENQEYNDNRDLKEKFFKIKDSLSRCGNVVCEIKEKEKIADMIRSFLNTTS